MQHIRLDRRSHRTAPHLAVTGEMCLRLSRTHEFCGPARRTLALKVAAQTKGPVLWIRPSWQAEHLNPDGLRPMLDPGRLILVNGHRADDLLWTAEESLRSGAIALVVADLPDPPGLTQVRRLHLAAETGAETGHVAPLAVLLVPGTGGAAGVESRWHMTGAHGPGRISWRLDRTRARNAPPRSWTMDADDGLTPYVGSAEDPRGGNNRNVT